MAVKFHEKSCGVVLYRTTENEKHFLLLQYPQGHWSFVKGHVGVGESEHETALRELQEETGIFDAEILANFREEISYWYQFDGKSSHKQVVYFLAKTSTTNVKLSHEHQNFQWVPESQVLDQLTFDNAKNLFQKAQIFLK